MVRLKNIPLLNEDNPHQKKGLSVSTRKTKTTTTKTKKATQGKTRKSINSKIKKSKENQLKEKILLFVEKYRKPVEEEDLPQIRESLKVFFDSQTVEPYHKVLDLRNEKQERRVVVIGDTHCDYNSLAGIMKKLLLTDDYDYFSNAYFVFLGDYLDRGAILFEYLLLLTAFKQIIGDRCIFLKGNHELIEYDQKTALLDSMVYPSDSCPLLNEYYGKDKEFLEKFGTYFPRLPYYILLKTQQGTDLLVHGGIPRDRYMDSFIIEAEMGEMMMTGEMDIRDKVLNNMIWSDPRKALFKIQGSSSRFEFGQEQFEAFANKNAINRIFRSHEPVETGVEEYYDGRLYTIFSTGGENNPDTGYPEVIKPAFAIINNEGTVYFESIY